MPAAGRGGARVLVVDGQQSTRAFVAGALARAGFATLEAADGASAERLTEAYRPDLIVLDTVLPDVDGLELARRFSENPGRTPVIFVAERDTSEDRVAGLAVAEDYLAKPVSPPELVARVRAVLRRTRGRTGEVLHFADLVLDEDSREVWRGGEPIELTATEFNLLRFFMLNPGRVLSKAQIVANVWADALEVELSVVETYVSYLRRKLDPAGSSLIQTVRFVGYALRERATY
jgi:two-component system, OmpR family, response regulator